MLAPARNESPSLVVPCSGEAARAWARGLLTDRELIFHSVGADAFLFASLPDISAWKNGVRQMIALWKAGARTAILRTGTPVVETHFLDIGAKCTFIEPPEIGGKKRFLVEAENVDKYLRRLA